MDEEHAKQVLYDLTIKQKELLELREELAEMGGSYRELGQKLTINPEFLVFPGQSVSGEYIGKGLIDLPANTFSEDYLKKKTVRIRELIKNITELKKQKKNLGL